MSVPQSNSNDAPESNCIAMLEGSLVPVGNAAPVPRKHILFIGCKQ